MMLNQSAFTPPEIRKLWTSDLPDITQHLLRLDAEARRLRFDATVSDAFVTDYAERVIEVGSVVFGAYRDGVLRAIGELRGVYQLWPPNAEIALTVEHDWQSQGIGSALFSRLVESAQNRGIKSLHVLFMTENRRMRQIAAKHHPGLVFLDGQVDASFDPPWPTPLSLVHEFVADSGAYVRQMVQAAI